MSVVVVIAAAIFLKERTHIFYKITAAAISISGLLLVG